MGGYRRLLFVGSHLLFMISRSPVYAWHTCDEGADVCPDGNKCCQGSFCLSGKNSSAGMCCNSQRGCREGYICGANFSCSKLNTTMDETLPKKIPQYKLCRLPNEALQQIHSLQIGGESAAYLSNMGPIDPDRHKDVEIVFIVVHGSGRNADDYLCCASSSIPANTLVVAPWFLAREDKEYAEGFLVWRERGPIPHTWRYGADAEDSHVSSYSIVDGLIELAEQLPRLKRIVVAGHSAGGQYVQRWALLTDHFPLHVRAVVANPKSFCWLDNRRMFKGHFRVPEDDAVAVCHTYNMWEWGLENSTEILSPYKDRALKQVGVERIKARYPGRDIVYLAGELDIERNGDCEARMQGGYRRMRSQHFYAALQIIYGRPVHWRLVVEGVHHDHCLMFQSPEGQRALFGDVEHGTLQLLVETSVSYGRATYPLAN